MLEKHKQVCKFIKTCKTLDELYPPHSKYSSVKRGFREFFLISEKNGRKCFTAKGTTGYIAEKEEQLNRHKRMIHPYSKFRECWEIMIILEFYLGLLCRPIFTCDCSNNYWSTFSYQIPALFADLFETADVFLLFFVGIINKETGNVMFNLKKIFLIRISDINFIFNLIGSLPLEFLVFVFKGKINEELPEVWKSVFFLKILKVFLITKYLTHIAKIYNWSELTTSIVWGIGISFLWCHWVACLYHQLVIFDIAYGHHTLGGIDSNNSKTHSGFLKHYAKILHVVSAILLDRNIVLHKSKIYTVNSTLFWLFIVSSIYFIGIIVFGLIVHYSALLRNSGIYYEEAKQEIQKFLVQENLPKQIHIKVKKYLEFCFRDNYFDEELIFKTLSPTLRREVASFLCMSLLMDPKSIFKDIPTDLATEVCLQMKSEVFLAGDIFFRAGSRGQKIYFLYRGSVAVYSEKGREIMHWYKGQYFGVSAFIPLLHPATVLALEISECYVLRYKDFLKAIDEATEYAEIVAKAASNRRQYILELYSEEFKA